ncbi:MAG: hypothetical protein ACFFCD_09925 [Promethearchaeota archaeon]
MLSYLVTRKIYAKIHRTSKERRINLDSRKNSNKIEPLLSLLLKEIDNEEMKSKELIPETQVVLRNETAVGRIENSELKVFDRHKGSQEKSRSNCHYIPRKWR